MTRLALPVLVALSSFACKAPVEAPANLGQASLYAYANFDGEDSEELIAAVVTFEEYLLSIDLDASTNDRALTLPTLTSEDWGGITGSADADMALQIPVAVSSYSSHGIAANIDLVAEANYVCVESDTTKYAARTYETDIGCFTDGSCDSVEVVQETRKESALADVWYDYHRTYRTVELDDGRQAMFARGWTDQVWFTDNGNGSWDQSYGLDLWLEDADDPSRTLRFTGNWSSVTLSAIGDDLWATLVKNGTDEAFANADDWIAGGEDCKVDRDRENDRP